MPGTDVIRLGRMLGVDVIGVDAGGVVPLDLPHRLAADQVVLAADRKLRTERDIVDAEFLANLPQRCAVMVFTGFQGAAGGGPVQLTAPSGSIYEPSGLVDRKAWYGSRSQAADVGGES